MATASRRGSAPIGAAAGPTVEDQDAFGAEADVERRNITRLIRFIALFVAVPTITIGLAFFLYSPADHVFHMVAFLGMGLLAVVVAVMAPTLARRFTDADNAAR